MDDPFLEAIDSRLADIEAAAAAERGPVDDVTRAGAIQMLVENMQRGNTDSARRLALAAAKLGPRFGELVEDIIAKSPVTAEREALARSQQPPAPDTSERVPRTGGPPEGQGAPILSEPAPARLTRASVDLNAPIQQPGPVELTDAQKWRNLQAAEAWGRRVRRREKNATDPGAGWMRK